MAALKINQIVEDLSAVRQTIAEVRAELMPLEAEEEALREQLMAELKSKSMKTINSDLTGELYSRAERFTFKIADPIKAIEYASTHDALKVDTSKIAKLLRNTDAPMPEDVGFTADVTEYLSIRTQKEN